MGSIFGQVKGDIGGNIAKLRKSHAENPAAFTTLQKMVQADIAAKTTNKSNSATESLLWLKRLSPAVSISLSCSKSLHVTSTLVAI
jgi:hypothetical protein